MVQLSLSELATVQITGKVTHTSVCPASSQAHTHASVFSNPRTSPARVYVCRQLANSLIPRLSPSFPSLAVRLRELYCKWRKAGRGLGNEARQLVRMRKKAEEAWDWLAKMKASSGNSESGEWKCQVDGERSESKSEIKQREERDRTDGTAWQH